MTYRAWNEEGMTGDRGVGIGSGRSAENKERGERIDRNGIVSADNHSFGTQRDLLVFQPNSVQSKQVLV